jgi:molybdate transport system substrate-binding protein
MRWLWFMVAYMLTYAQAQPIRVAVAANLRDAFLEVVRQFQQIQPDIQVLPSFGPSGAFVQQIGQGAPFDLFLSADVDSAKALQARGQAEPGSLRVYARGKLVLFVPKRTGIKPTSLNDLTKPEFKRIAIANPETAPYGRAAIEAFKSLGIYEAIKTKLVFGTDVAQVAQQTLIAADAGLLPYSSIVTKAFKNQGHTLILPTHLYTPLNQAMVVIKGRNRPEVQALVDFLGQRRAKQVLQTFGYQTP